MPTDEGGSKPTRAGIRLESLTANDKAKVAVDLALDLVKGLVGTAAKEGLPSSVLQTALGMMALESIRTVGPLPLKLVSVILLKQFDTTAKRLNLIEAWQESLLDRTYEAGLYKLVAAQTYPRSTRAEAAFRLQLFREARAIFEQVMILEAAKKNAPEALVYLVARCVLEEKGGAAYAIDVVQPALVAYRNQISNLDSKIAIAHRDRKQFEASARSAPEKSYSEKVETIRKHRAVGVGAADGLYFETIVSTKWVDSRADWLNKAEKRGQDADRMREEADVIRGMLAPFEAIILTL